MKKSIKIIFILTLSMIVLLINSTVYADSDACKIDLSSNKTTLNIGDEIQLSIKMSNITTSEAIANFAGQLDYDQDVFEIEYITDSTTEENLGLSDLRNETGASDLKIAYYEEGGWYIACQEIEGADGAAIMGETTGDPATSSTTIGIIKLKVKDTATTTTTTISLRSTSVVDVKEKTYELSKEASVNFTVNAINTTIQSGTQNTTNSKIQNIATTSNETANSTANTSAPYTGVEEILPIIFVVAIITVVAFVKFVKYKDI